MSIRRHIVLSIILGLVGTSLAYACTTQANVDSAANMSEMAHEYVPFAWYRPEVTVAKTAFAWYRPEVGPAEPAFVRSRPESVAAEPVFAWYRPEVAAAELDSAIALCPTAADDM